MRCHFGGANACIDRSTPREAELHRRSCVSKSIPNPARPLSCNNATMQANKPEKAERSPREDVVDRKQQPPSPPAATLSAAACAEQMADLGSQRETPFRFFILFVGVKPGRVASSAGKGPLLSPFFSFGTLIKLIFSRLILALRISPVANYILLFESGLACIASCLIQHAAPLASLPKSRYCLASQRAEPVQRRRNGHTYVRKSWKKRERENPEKRYGARGSDAVALWLANTILNFSFFSALILRRRS